MATSRKGTGVVGYDVQTAVDVENHLIVAHEVTNVGHDRTQLMPMGLKIWRTQADIFCQSNLTRSGDEAAEVIRDSSPSSTHPIGANAGHAAFWCPHRLSAGPFLWQAFRKRSPPTAIVRRHNIS